MRRALLALLLAASAHAHAAAHAAWRHAAPRASAPNRAAAPVAAPLPAAALEALERDGWCVVPQWLPADAVSAILADAEALDAAGLPREAGVGSTRSGSTARRMDTEVRRSRMLPLIPAPSPARGHVDTRLALAAAVEALRAELDAAAALPTLAPLAPFQTELSYLFYPPGGHYLRHVDVPSVGDGWNALGRRAEDGGSFSGAQVRREVSLLLYLNAGWRAEDGGELRLFTGAEQEARGQADGPPDGEHVDVLPEGGTLVLMRSARVPHEVRTTRAARQCVVGWYRAMRSDR